MKVLICGDRNYTDHSTMYRYIESLSSGTLIINGACRGADKLSTKIAEELGMRYKEYPANWKLYGKRAGPIRNQEMLDMEHPDIVVAFHDDIESSKGTKHMINLARKYNIKVILFT